MRKLIAVTLMLAFMALWIWGAGTVGTRLTGVPSWLQLVFYIVAGCGWVPPALPLPKWTNATGVPDGAHRP